MLFLKEYKHRPDTLSDLLPWAAVVAPGVVLNKDGSFQATISYRGPDLDSSTESELMMAAAQVNNAFRRLGTGWALYCEADRRLHNNYPTSTFPDSLSFLIDEERRCAFENNTNFESTYYLTLIYLPPTDIKTKIAAKFVESSQKSEGLTLENMLTGFLSEVTRIRDLLHTVMLDVHQLTDEENLTYLHGTISPKRHPVVLPDTPMYLDAYLADTPLISGFTPSLGDRHLRVISVRGLPGKSTPGILDRLNRLSIEYRWVSRFICLSKLEAEAELKRYRRDWFAKRKSIGNMIGEMITGGPAPIQDNDAVAKAADADSALGELNQEYVAYGFYTQSIVILNENERIADEQAKEIERTINSLGFVTRTETVNAVDAFLGTIPGNCRNNVRRPLINTLNLAHLMPLSSVWGGPRTNTHLNAPPLFFAKTGGATQFRFSTHIGDVGHTLILGPTGAGKSVFLNFLEAQFLRYKNACVYIFDKGGSARSLTAGVGGDYYDLGADGSKLAFQPLSRIDSLHERRWALDWIIEIIAQENLPITPSIKESVWTALNALSTAPKPERTIYGLTILLQDESIRKALTTYSIHGTYGHILDADTDTLSLGRWQCFEMEVLMETPNVVGPVLSYLFHRLEEKFQGQPTLLVLDEAWLFLDNPVFEGKIREWLKVLRKANVSVIFATQSIADIQGSRIAATIKEACLTKIYLPNSTALNEETSKIYRNFGLNDRQIRIIAEARPKNDYYYTSPHGNRLFELQLAGLVLLYCAGASKERTAKIKEIQASVKTTDQFNYRFLMEHKFDEVANIYAEVASGSGRGI